MAEKKDVKTKKPKKAKIVNVIGKRKNAVARATARTGTGKIRINSKPLELIRPEIARLKILEPVMIAGDSAKGVDISVNVSGGGIMGQAEAVRQSLALGLVAFDRKLKSKYLKYDRTLLVADVRRNEPHKPSRSKSGPRRHKQRSKR